jgi:NAD(P)-dependent dehydrogenase (short-subunit alcohol dehydrogenase family)
MLLEGKVAIITGGAQGIGKGIAKVFSGHGAKVVICDINLVKAKDAAEEIGKATGETPMVVLADVSVKAQVDIAVSKVVEVYGRIDILVNNAGIQIYNHPFIDLPEEIWDLHYNINVKGTYLFSQAVAKIMVKQCSGKIINISSDSGVDPNPINGAAYCSSKSAVIGLTRNIAKELGRYGVYCNAICPGSIENTGMLEDYTKVFGKKTKENIEAISLKRLGFPEEIGKAALFLASDMSSFMTGEHMLVTGGGVMSQ